MHSSSSYPTTIEIAVPDNSMMPLFPPGRSLKMNVVNAYHGDGIYALRCDGAFFIRLVQRVPGGYRIKPKNADYDAFNATPGDVVFCAKLPFRH